MTLDADHDYERTGVIVAGGRSTRFGDRDKTVADLAGVPMIRRVAEALTECCDHLVVNCRADQREAIAEALSGLTVTVAVDPTPDRGPVAGIRTGLGEVKTAYAAVVAADMPFVDPAFVDYLFERAAGHDAAVPRPDEWYQPLQAVYRADEMRDACDEALSTEDGGDGPKIMTPIFELDYVVVSADEIARHTTVETFENINTEAECRAAAARFESG